LLILWVLEMIKKNRTKKELPYTAIDLFCGGGGLTLGLKRAGFQVIAGVDNNSKCASTFQSNHKDVSLFIQDVRDISGSDLMGLSPKGEVSLLSGCPPCQGFTTLTSKYKREDPRNRLISEMLRIALEIMPTAIMMENVPGLAHKGKNAFEEMIDSLQNNGYEVNYDVLQVADFGVPQFRRRLVLFAGKGFSIPMPKPTHSIDGIGAKRWKTVRDAISDMDSPYTLAEARSLGVFYRCNWHLIRNLSADNLKRIRSVKAGDPRTSIPKRFRPECHKDRSEGFQNVYGRMEWDKVSPTITGNCTTFSSGRFGHPEEDRTISVREAARLQTFPDNYTIDTEFMGDATAIIGNALPCAFAQAMAKQCLKFIKQYS